MLKKIDDPLQNALFKSIVICFVCALIIFVIMAYFAYSKEYDRSYFKHWSDLNGNGLNTRQEQLILQSIIINGVHTSKLSNDSTIINGIWVCPYTAEIIENPSLLDIDHIVPLKYAWEHGADLWTNEQREIFANDPENLLVVRDIINQSKSDKGIDKWVPPNAAYVDDYLSKFANVCFKYQLSCDLTRIADILKRFNKVKHGFTGGAIYGDSIDCTTNKDNSR